MASRSVAPLGVSARVFWLGLGDGLEAAGGGLEEGVALRGGDHRASGPDLGGACAVWSGNGVGFMAGGFGVGRGPVTGAETERRVAFCSNFQRTDGRFDGAIIAWHTGRRVQVFHGELFAEFSELLGNEGGTVIAFQDERRSVDNKERPNHVDERAHGRIGDGKPEQHLATGQVADGEQVWTAAVDGLGTRTVEVDSPDRSGGRPVEFHEHFTMASSPDSAEAVKDVGDLDAPQVGELGAQARHADGRAEFVDAADHEIALGRRPSGRAGRGEGRRAAVRRPGWIAIRATFGRIRRTDWRSPTRSTPVGQGDPNSRPRARE